MWLKTEFEQSHDRITFGESIDRFVDPTLSVQVVVGILGAAANLEAQQAERVYIRLPGHVPATASSLIAIWKLHQVWQ